MKRELVYSPEAIDDLDEIFWFIAEDNPQRARTYIAEIEQACRNLCEMPFVGPARPDLHPELRLLFLWRRIVVAYKVLADRIDVLRVFSGGQDYEAIMRSG